jgi:superfamily II DNA/RNA helicase
MRKSDFERYELHPRSIDAVNILGFPYPTQVQEKVIPLFMQKKNLIVEAPTGTGKTAAYGLPLIAQLNLLKRSTQALVLLPTRELATQVAESLIQLFDGDDLKVGLVIGGQAMEDSLQFIKREPHIIVAVPGRLKDVMTHNPNDYFWRDIKFLIADEGDKLLEMGFAQNFEWIKRQIRSTVQMGFFSATISADAEKMMREKLNKPEVIRLSAQQVLRNISFQYVDIQAGAREPYLAGLLHQEKIKKALIFCEKRDEIQTLTGYLRNYGYLAEAYYGSQEAAERANILRRFKEGHIQYLVGSDLAARGLDILDLPAVINCSIPSEFDYYVHRVGRTGRAGNKGKVYNLILNEIEMIEMNRHHTDLNIPIKECTVEPMLKRAAVDTRRVRCHFSRGKKDKMRTADIVGFLVHNAYLNANEIGTITIYDSYAIADIPQDGLDTLNQNAEHLSLKGKSIKVRKFTVEEQEHIADSVKTLLKDRPKTKEPEYVMPEEVRLEREKKAKRAAAKTESKNKYLKKGRKESREGAKPAVKKITRGEGRVSKAVVGKKTVGKKKK